MVVGVNRLFLILALKRKCKSHKYHCISLTVSTLWAYTSRPDMATVLTASRSPLKSGVKHSTKMDWFLVRGKKMIGGHETMKEIKYNKTYLAVVLSIIILQASHPKQFEDCLNIKFYPFAKVCLGVISMTMSITFICFYGYS